MSSTFSGVNGATLKLAPPEATQLGRCLDHALCSTHESDPPPWACHAPESGLANGFYRIWLSEEPTPRLGVIFPSRPDEEEPLARPFLWLSPWAGLPLLHILQLPLKQSPTLPTTTFMLARA